MSQRQTVFFTSVDPMNKEHKDPNNIDLEAPRLSWYKQKRWEISQETVYRVDIKFAQQKGFKFYPIRSNAVILNVTFPAYCISKAIVIKSQETMYQKVYVSPRPPPKISYKDNWMCELDSGVAGSSKDTQRIQPKTQLSSTERPVCGQESTTEIEKRTEFDHDTLSQEKHDEVTDSTSTGRPVCGTESTKRCVLTLKHVEEDQTGTVRPVLVDQKEEHEIDFRVPQDCHMQL